MFLNSFFSIAKKMFKNYSNINPMLKYRQDMVTGMSVGETTLFF